LNVAEQQEQQEHQEQHSQFEEPFYLHSEYQIKPNRTLGHSIMDLPPQMATIHQNSINIQPHMIPGQQFITEHMPHPHFIPNQNGISFSNIIGSSVHDKQYKYFNYRPQNNPKDVIIRNSKSNSADGYITRHIETAPFFDPSTLTYKYYTEDDQVQRQNFYPIHSYYFAENPSNNWGNVYHHTHYYRHPFSSPHPYNQKHQTTQEDLNIISQKSFYDQQQNGLSLSNREKSLPPKKKQKTN